MENKMKTGENLTNNNYTTFLRVFSTCFIACKRQLFETRGILLADDRLRLIWRDVDILLPELCLGGRRVDGLGKLLALL